MVIRPPLIITVFVQIRRFEFRLCKIYTMQVWSSKKMNLMLTESNKSQAAVQNKHHLWTFLLAGLCIHALALILYWTDIYVLG